MTHYYFELDDLPCRIDFTDDDTLPVAEIYKPGKGFEPWSYSEIRIKGIPISKAEFDQLIINMTQKH